MDRILHIISQYPGRTGSGVYLNEMIREGQREGYIQGIVFGIEIDQIYKNPYIRKEYLYPIEFSGGNLPFYIVGMSDEMPYPSTRFRDLDRTDLEKYKKSFEEIIEKAIRDFKPDIIFAHHLWISSSIVCRLVARINPSIKVIALCHGTDIRQLDSLKHLESYIVEGLKSVDGILSLNQEQKNSIENLYRVPRDKVHVVGGGYNEDIFYPPDWKVERQETIRLVYAGKLSKSKGILAMLRAVNELEEEVELLLVGSGVGAELEEIQDLSRENRHKVVFLGEVKQEELGEVFRTGHIFIMPSYYEGLSLVSIEALASGLLLVASRLKGLYNYLGTFINQSGSVSYVDLPRIYDLDKPYPEDLCLYSVNLKEAIELQISRIEDREYYYENIEDRLYKMSWEHIFKNILEIVEKIYKKC